MIYTHGDLEETKVRRTHIRAVEAAIRSGSDVLTDAHRPLLELCRVLARQMDEAANEPSSRLAAAYLSALKDLTRALSGQRKPQPSSKLAQLRASRIAS